MRSGAQTTTVPPFRPSARTALSSESNAFFDDEPSPGVLPPAKTTPLSAFTSGICAFAGSSALSVRSKSAATILCAYLLSTSQVAVPRTRGAAMEESAVKFAPAISSA